MARAILGGLVVVLAIGWRAIAMSRDSDEWDLDWESWSDWQ
jgi:hypothetical protein